MSVRPREWRHRSSMEPFWGWSKDSHPGQLLAIHPRCTIPVHAAPAWSLTMLCCSSAHLCSAWQLLRARMPGRLCPQPPPWPCPQAAAVAYDGYLCSCLKHQGKLPPSPHRFCSVLDGASTAIGWQQAQQHQCTHQERVCTRPSCQLFGIAKGHRGKELRAKRVFRDKPDKQYFAFH